VTLKGFSRVLEPDHPPGRLQLAANDLGGAIALWPLWVRLGWHDILYRYRRSLLGPFWFTANTAVTIVALGIVYSEILKMPVAELMPYVCVGLLVWGFISAILHGAGEVFSGAESYIKQVRLPYLLYVFRFIWSKIIIFAHDFPIFVALIIYFGIWPGTVALLAIPGFLLLSLNGALITVTLGMASARFRDVPRIVTSLAQIIFLITPILWTPDMLGSRIYLAYGNPFFHLIEIVRRPLLGSLPSSETVWVALFITAFNLIVTLVIFSRYRARIAYWL
jgi:ABC-2 type transport system permease protein/lipopolysaccharide transport system permease protein